MGRSTFELAREYDDVVGVDFSRAFVAKCNELKRDGKGDYAMVVEGDLVDCKTAYVDATIVSPATSYDRFIVLYIKMEFSRVNNFCVFHISYSNVQVHCTLRMLNHNYWLSEKWAWLSSCAMVIEVQHLELLSLQICYIADPWMAAFVMRAKMLMSRSVYACGTVQHKGYNSST